MRRWRLEIEEILVGNRQSTIMEVGSVRQYISRLLSDSTQLAKSRASFEEALASAVSGWQPNSTRALYNRLLLELIVGFTPPNGFERVLSHFMNRGYFGRTDDIEGASRDDDQGAIALMALEAYYPGPPVDRGQPGFKLYEDLLWRLAGTQEHVGHACRRLLELRLVSPDDQRVREMINSADVLEEFVQYAIGAHKGLLQGQIGQVLAHCLSLRNPDPQSHPYPLYEHFKSEIQRFGAVLDQANFPPRILFDVDESKRTEDAEEKNVLDLFVPEASFAAYMASLHYEAQATAIASVMENVL